MIDEERLQSLQVIIDQGAPFPADEFAKLTVGSQIALELRMRAELEDLAGELGPEGLDAAIEHLEGLLAELVAGGAPGAIVSDMKGTIERLRLRRADYH